jgi:hypothetical protein
MTLYSNHLNRPSAAASATGVPPANQDAARNLASVVRDSEELQLQPPILTEIHLWIQNAFGWCVEHPVSALLWIVIILHTVFVFYLSATGQLIN